MPQLNLNFTDLPEHRPIVWEQLGSQQKKLVVETLARILSKVSQPGKSEEPSHD